MPAVPVAAQKREIRARLLAARRALPAAVRQDAAGRVQATIAAAVAPHAGSTIAGYVPMTTEPGGPDLPAVLARALGPYGRLLLPVLREDRDLDWTAYRDPGHHDPGHHDPGHHDPGPRDPGPRDPGHHDPGHQRLGMAAIQAASLLVVPAVAVDRGGVRLGRGGGSYDRALARVAPGTEVVALLHDGELLAEPLPADPHDQPVTTVVTPALGLVRLASRA